MKTTTSDQIIKAIKARLVNFGSGSDETEVRAALAFVQEIISDHANPVITSEKNSQQGFIERISQ